MKMLFFSSDGTEVQAVSREFIEAGIPCEVRNVSCGKERCPRDAELWIRNDGDCHKALMLCVQRNIGFARRPLRPVEDEEFAIDC
jgi:hypothetical protein